MIRIFNYILFFDRIFYVFFFSYLCLYFMAKFFFLELIFLSNPSFCWLYFILLLEKLYSRIYHEGLAFKSKFFEFFMSSCKHNFYIIYFGQMCWFDMQASNKEYFLNWLDHQSILFVPTFKNNCWSQKRSEILAHKVKDQSLICGTTQDLRQANLESHTET